MRHINLFLGITAFFMCSCAYMGAPNFSDCNYSTECLDAYWGNPASTPSHEPAAVIPVKAPTHAIHVAILETTASVESVSLDERQYMTDVLRARAVDVLPPGRNYTIMTRENIRVMLPPDRRLEDCEGSCAVETGKNIAADYVVQAHIGKWNNGLTIAVELYNTGNGRLLKSFTGNGKSINELLRIIQSNTRQLFLAISNG